MAYAAAVTVTEKTISGRRYKLFTIAETEAAATSEFELTSVFPMGQILVYRATLTAGTGTTINPIIGSAAAFTAATQAEHGTLSTTAAHVNEQDPLIYSSTDGGIFIRSTANDATADHSISTLILIGEGVQ